MRYYVMRTHSHTDRQQLWKVMSKGIIDKPDAQIMLDYVKSKEKNTKHKFFLVLQGIGI